MPIQSPRPLSQIVADIAANRTKVTKAVAEEMNNSIAADGVISKAEREAMQGFVNYPPANIPTHLSDPGFKSGTQMGKAFVQELAKAVDSAFSIGAATNKLAPIPGAPNGWFTPKWKKVGVKIDAPAITQAMRNYSVPLGAMDKLARTYPKAQNFDRTFGFTLKPEVSSAIDKINSDWRAGRIPDGVNVETLLKPILDARFS